MSRTLVLLSGGLDSSLVLRLVPAVRALFFDYGQQSLARERACARAQARMVGVPLDIVRLSGVFGVTGLTGGSLPSAGKWSSRRAAKALVPARNLVFLSVAVARALALGLDSVAIGTQGDDGADNFPDTTPSFTNAMDAMVALADARRVRVLAPLAYRSKAETVGMSGKILGSAAAKTWSCYRAGKTPCMSCRACLKRYKGGA